MKIGLFGGSFNPPHEGHLHVCELALRRARLDQIWWLVTPGNPLKDHDGLAPLEQRINACREIANHPQIKITAFEASLNVRYTADTLRLVIQRRPRLKFVWVMGADNLASFHLWQDWRSIAARMPIMVIDRPGATLSYLSAPAALALSRYRIDEDDAPLLPGLNPPAWTFVHGPRNSLSSTKLRELQVLDKDASAHNAP
jgi:nicotinate-nucleotide adenylyltransferase